LQRTIEAGAVGVEIAIRGKLTTDRARYEKYKSGYLPSVGDAISRIVRTAVVDTQLKQGLFGISVKLMPPNVSLPDRPIIRESGEASVPKPVIVEVKSTSEEPDVTPEVAEVADIKKT
jgi:small subunit ribosomal protein S3